MATNEEDPKVQEEIPSEELESVSGGVIGDCTRPPKWPLPDYPISITPMPIAPIIIPLE